MNVQEIEKELNITRANIRFYEKEGLLTPPRKANGYRDYGEADIARLKKIIIFRKLGISVADIKSIFDGSLSLQTAIDANTQRLQKEIEELNGAIKVCRQIKENNAEEADFPQDYFWDVINKCENDGENFNDIFSDYSSFVKFILDDAYHFNYDKIKEKAGIKGIIIIVLIVSLFSGIWELIFERQELASFAYGFIRPFILFLGVCILVFPAYFFGKRNSKLAGIYVKILSVIIGIILIVIFGLLIYAVFSAIFNLLFI